jgi:ribosomal protein L11 methyltransferase
MINQKNWIEVTVPLAPESFEAVENFLFENGCSGCEESERSVRGYFPGDVDSENLRKILITYLGGLKTLGFSVGDPVFCSIPTEDWNYRWRKRFKPIRVSDRIVIKPPWRKWAISKGEIVIPIMPRMAFGTGSHETTQLCLELLEKYLNFSDVVLDLGTGSGILAIAAARLGGSKIFAIDTDEDAIDHARENVLLNGVDDQVEFCVGSVDVVGLRVFDFIVANIDRTTIINLIPRLKEYVCTHTKLVFSGILCDEKFQVENKLAICGFRNLEVRSKGEWCGIVVTPDSD